MNILDKIVEQKRIEVNTLYQQHTLSKKLHEAHLAPSRSSFASRVYQHIDSAHIIAEFKRKSPSKGTIAKEANVHTAIPIYTHLKASGISVLTDELFFDGKLEDLKVASTITKIPLLRKDFIIDPIQIADAKINGASIILLIASILTASQTKALTNVAKELGLEIIFEIHDAAELDKFDDRIECVGVNTRNLKDFEMKMENASDLLKKLPKNTIKIAESGIDDPNQIQSLHSLGYNAFLIGETFMRNLDNPQFLAPFFNTK